MQLLVLILHYIDIKSLLNEKECDWQNCGPVMTEWNLLILIFSKELNYLNDWLSNIIETDKQTLDRVLINRAK